MSIGTSTAEIRNYLCAPACNEAFTQIMRVASVAGAGPDAVVFASGPAVVARAVLSSAGLILVAESESTVDSRLIRVREPRQAFAQVYYHFFRPKMVAEVHPSATVEQGAVLSVGSRVEAGAYVGPEVRIGADCWIGPRAVILSHTTLGDRVRVQAGAVLGSDGFGFVRAEQGYLGFPQIGTLTIGDDVEIGAGTTIDRGALEATVIGRGTKIDNLVHIAHNCQIGEDVLMAAQVGIAGSSIIGDGAILGGQVGIGEHAFVGKGVILGGSAGVLSHKRVEGPGVVFWGTPAQPVRDYLRDVARMRRGR